MNGGNFVVGETGNITHLLSMVTEASLKSMDKALRTQTNVQYMRLK